MPDIFISYAKQDQATAEYIIKALNISPVAQPDDCDHFLLIYSAQAAASDRVRHEVIQALMRNKAFCSLWIDKTPLGDFLFLLDLPHYELISPDQAEAALHGLAEFFELPPVAAPAFSPGSPSTYDAKQEAAPPLSPEVIDEILFTGMEREDAIGAFLVQSAAHFPDGITAMVQARQAAAQTKRLQQLIEGTEKLLLQRDWAALNTVLDTMRFVATSHPMIDEFQGKVQEAQLEDLWKQAQAHAKTDGWRNLDDLLQVMQALNPDDPRTQQLIANLARTQECNEVYAVAERAQAAGHFGAVSNLLTYITNHCPDYHDHRNLLKNLPLQPGYVRNLRSAARFAEHNAPVLVLTFSPDSSLLVSGGGDDALCIWDMDGLKRMAIQRREDGPIESASFSRDGLFLVSTTGSSIVRIWSMPEGREAVTLDEFKLNVTYAVFSDDANALICGSQTGEVAIINIESGAILYVFRAHDHGITKLQITPDRQHLITASNDRLIKIWSFNGADQSSLKAMPDHVLKGHTMSVNDMMMSEDESLLASVGTDGQLLLWDLRTEKVRSRFTHEHAQQFRTIALHNTLIATGNVDRLIRFHDAGSGSVVHTLEAHDGAVNALVFSPDGKTLASGSSDRSIQIWRLG